MIQVRFISKNHAWTEYLPEVPIKGDQVSATVDDKRREFVVQSRKWILLGHGRYAVELKVAHK